MKSKSKKSDPLLLWLAVFAVILITGSFLLLSQIGKEEREEMVTTTTVTTTTTTTTTTLLGTTTTITITTSTTITTTTSTTTSSTTTTIKQKIKTCDDYCINSGYRSGICRINPSGCIIKGVNEVYSPRGNRYCPRGEIEDSCCCVAR